MRRHTEAYVAEVNSPLLLRPSAPVRMEDLARLRQAVYRFLGALFLYPEEGRFSFLVEAAKVLNAEIEVFAAFPFFAPWQRLIAWLAEDSRRPDAVDLGEGYMRLFGANPHGPPFFPYESFYLDPGRHLGGWLSLQVGQEYNAAGLMPSPSLNELPDHVSMELEFMSFLCAREAEAWEAKDAGEALRNLERQRAFLEEHLGRWFPLFARDIKRSDGSGLYAATAEAAEAFLHHDLDLLQLLLSRLPEVAG